MYFERKNCDEKKITGYPVSCTVYPAKSESGTFLVLIEKPYTVYSIVVNSVGKVGSGNKPTGRVPCFSVSRYQYCTVTCLGLSAEPVQPWQL